MYEKKKKASFEIEFPVLVETFATVRIESYVKEHVPCSLVLAL